MTKKNKKSTTKVGDKEYITDDLSGSAKLQIANIQFSDEKISQLQNELAISNTARNGYLRALNKELSKTKISDD